MSKQTDMAKQTILEKLSKSIVPNGTKTAIDGVVNAGVQVLSDELEKLAEELEVEEAEKAKVTDGTQTPPPATPPAKSPEGVPTEPKTEPAQEAATTEKGTEAEKEKETKGDAAGSSSQDGGEGTSEPSKSEPEPKTEPKPTTPDNGDGADASTESEEEKAQAEVDKVANELFNEFKDFLNEKLANVPALSKALAIGGLAGSGGIGAFIGHKATSAGNDDENAQIAQQMYELGQMSIIDQLGGIE